VDAVPVIDREALLARLQRRFPLAQLRWEWINPQYRSWLIEVRTSTQHIEINWGPLSGFGATDLNDQREDVNPFGAFDWPLETVEEAVDFVSRVLAQ
jgi:hypothetical protein